MPNKVPPPLRLLLAVALALAPLIVALAGLAANGLLHPLLAALVALASALASLAVIRRVDRDLKAVAAYVQDLADGRDDAAAPLVGGPSGAIATAVARMDRAARDRCNETQAQLEADEHILEALHDPLILVGGNRQVVRANTAARALFGERMVARDLASSLRTPAVLEAVDAVLAGAASRIVEFTLPVPVERALEARIKPFQRRLAVSSRDEKEGGPAAVRHVLVTLHDITALRRSEQMRADFIANASHELRTPLSSLLGFIETLRGPAAGDTEAHERFLGIMHEQASRMSRLVKDLLSLSRIELDEHMPPAGRVDVVDSLKRVISAFELKAATRRIHVRLEAPAGLAPVVGDGDQLAHVFQNLISNAIKYAREGTEVLVVVSVSDGAMVGAPTQLALSGRRAARPGGQMVSVAVSDHGEGIARTHLPRLTERFYRVDAARSRALGGTGLGLAIVKHIMNRHRGRMTIESEVGHGSTFTVYLPLAVDQGAEALRRIGNNAA